MTETKLKPCPFCGSSDVKRSKFFEYWRVVCVNCETKSGLYNTYLSAMLAWNRRANNAEVK